jgi:DNA-binding response OmpR family regulator
MDTRKRILIIDDESDMAILLRQVLGNAMFDAEIAIGGHQGLEKATTGHFDLILLDVRMPHMDGMEVMRNLRQREETKHIPVIFLTGSSLDVDQIVAAIDLDPADFITKAVSSKELVARINWAFRKQHPV